MECFWNAVFSWAVTFREYSGGERRWCVLREE